MSESALRARLSDCLMTAAELDASVESLAAWDDPFPRVERTAAA
ncbi:hypothetical protein [Alienimonas californiensis]|uniref:Uncharacterized protein n=1 Tax=Alienimonas californiensis TaxID=2527989 RepID=A0A517P5U2_9PLAN|nr:hypothetical protein [Alienimonas californiensis]QDT14741.1 hypothetical protein CA12_08190 [Alienimonas californiensis]